jgi:hypothetical protein
VKKSIAAQDAAASNVNETIGKGSGRRKPNFDRSAFLNVQKDGGCKKNELCVEKRKNAKALYTFYQKIQWSAVTYT